MSGRTLVYSSPELAAYGFPGGHPFGPDRHDAFMGALVRSRCFDQLEMRAPTRAGRDVLESFHTPDYVDFVAAMSERGAGLLDQGDTPAYAGVFEAAATAVGATLDALAAIMSGEAARAFNPIGGLHHARRDGAAGFCVFNDCGVAIEIARSRYGLARVAYVDIDAHHGDGVFYAFEDDPIAVIADTHEDGRFLYPGTGRRDEAGTGEAVGTKLNIPLPPGAGNREFMQAWDEIEAFLEGHTPQLFLLQCGADSIVGDPLTHLELTIDAHGHAAERLRVLADRFAEGRLIAMGGGGYNRDNLARGWTRVVEALC